MAANRQDLGSRETAPSRENQKAQPPAVDIFEEEPDQKPKLIEFANPEFLELFLGAIGVRDLQFKIAQERAKRAEEFYQNPYPMINTVVTSLHFDTVMGMLIFANAVVLGWEASSPEGENADLFELFEYLFAFVFCVEWWMRLLAFGWSWPFEWANAADTFLVYGTGVFLKPLQLLRVDVDGLRIYTALRALRLVRLARSVRLHPSFKELWILVQGLMTSTRALIWVSCIAVALLFTFAVIATELVGRNPVFADDEYALELFGDLGKSMFTLLQLITLDTWADTIARPLMEKEPFLMAIYVLSFIGIGVFVFWNLITAVVVDAAFKIADEDAQQQERDAADRKRNELKSLKDLFLMLDADKSGALSKDEFFTQLETPQMQQQLQLIGFNDDEMVEAWHLLDDGDGELTIKEFTDGLRRMKGDATAKDVADTQKRLKETEHRELAIKTQVTALCNSMKSLEDASATLTKDTDEVLGIFMEMYHRLAAHVEKGEKEDKANHQRRLREQRIALQAAEKEAALAESGAAAGGRRESRASARSSVASVNEEAGVAVGGVLSSD
eukprot:TRINITY_DN48935_c0_g1_i1.p1 TRINITY_DN48935_c0_g1~~TRINITY_DN48935_c0_g1_i1.p1  ORF type:complete len:558 (+),score=150.63 TRINITY_DN48935_c0_g1_i1:118-1791(+)